MIASRETLLSLLYRITSIGLTFVAVSCLVKVLGPARYGAWATLVSALIWIQMSDFGVGYVIKNRVAAGTDRAALYDQIAVAVYLSSAIGLILVALYALFGARLSIVSDFPLEAGLLYMTAFISLPAMIGVNILQGVGKATVSFRATMFQALAWLAYILILGNAATLRALAIGFSALWFVNALYNFTRGYAALGGGATQLAGKMKSLPQLATAVPLLRVGGAFFLLQMASLVLFNLGTYLAYTYLSASAAAQYDILNKIYQIPTTLFNVVIAVAWTTIASHIGQGDSAAVRRIHGQLLAASASGGMLLVLLSFWIVAPFVRLYSHGQLDVGRAEVVAFAAQVAVQMVAYAGAVFMNAAERLKIQIGFSIASMVLFLPIFHALQAQGLAAIPLATLFVVLPGALYFNYYARRHIIGQLDVKQAR